MFTEKKNTVEQIGKVAGFLFSFVLFSTILFFVLTFLNKFPASWTYYHMFPVTIVLILIGSKVRKILS